MTNHDIDKAFVSTYDTFLYTFDRDHDKTPSQLKEMIKHQRIAELRDNANPSLPTDDIWQGF